MAKDYEFRRELTSKLEGLTWLALARIGRRRFCDCWLADGEPEVNCCLVWWFSIIRLPSGNQGGVSQTFKQSN